MSTKPPKILGTLLKLACACAAVFLSVRFLLPWLAPFVLAAAVAVILEPVIVFLRRRLRFPRSLASLLCVVAFYAAFAGLIWALVCRVAGEMQVLFERLPQILESISRTLGNVEAWFLSVADRAPDGLGIYIQSAVESIGDQLSSLPAMLSGKAFEMITALASATPDVMLFAVTALIGTYFVSSSYSEIRSFVLLQIPEDFQSRARMTWADLKRTFGRYIKAQALLTLITFGELVLAFALLKIKYTLSLALFTAVVDALPVFGTGTVLLPWALYCFSVGDVSLGVGLVITYLVVTIFRNLIQAKILGDQLGLHPLVTLLSIYVGFRIFGIIGMIILPLLVITLKQLGDNGLIKLWKTP